MRVQPRSADMSRVEKIPLHTASSVADCMQYEYVSRQVHASHRGLALGKLHFHWKWTAWCPVNMLAARTVVARQHTTDALHLLSESVQVGPLHQTLAYAWSVLHHLAMGTEQPGQTRLLKSQRLQPWVEDATREFHTNLKENLSQLRAVAGTTIAAGNVPRPLGMGGHMAFVLKQTSRNENVCSCL